MRRRRNADGELAEELRAHVGLLIDERIRAGMTPDEARRNALLEMGGMAQVAEAVRDTRRGAWLMGVTRDLRYALRTLRRDPAVTIIAVLTLSIGIAANTAIFTVADAVLFRALPVRAPNELIAIGKSTAVEAYTIGAPRGDVLSFPLYRDLRDDKHLVTGLAATGTARRLDVRIGAIDDFEHPAGRYVSGNYFDVLGVSAERGRVLTASDDRQIGDSPVAVLSDAYWRDRFGADPNVVGRVIRVGAARLTIIGVAARGFGGDVLERPTEIWLPITMAPLVDPHSVSIDDRGRSWLLLIGRLAPGVSLAQARAAFTTLIRRNLAANANPPGDPARYDRVPVIVTAGGKGFSAIRSAYAAPLRILSIGVAILLLIVCTNVANLSLARGIARGREMTLRLALGAGRWLLVRQLLVESGVLALVGCGLGVALAWAGSRVVVTMAATNDVPIATPRIDVNVLIFAFLVTIVAVLLFGLVPALRVSSIDIASALRMRGRSAVRVARSTSRSGVPIGRALIPLQVTLSLVLLVGAALLTRSLRELQTKDPGVDRDHLLVVDIDVAKRGYRGDRLLALVRQMRERLASLPGARDVSYSQNGLFSGHRATALVAVPGFDSRSPEDSILPYDLVGSGYVRAIGGHLLRGRDIAESDAVHQPSVAVVNDVAERFYFGRQSAVGKVIYFDAGVPTTIVGVVAGIRDRELAGDVGRRAYVPYVQEIGDSEEPSLVFVVRTGGDPSLLTTSVRAVVASIDRDLPIWRVTPLSALMRDSIREEQLLARVALTFGLIALLLAGVGLYGVMHYAVSRRTSEIGIRTALGASRVDVLRLVLTDGLRLVIVGLVLGLPLSWLAARSLRALLDNVAPTDVVSLVSAMSVLLGCAALAAFLPALRASRVQPVVALREE
ncbi:MAG TPA: ABC transporter permease [Gemmatimonadaceae bacterium]|jgi:predicted permease